MSDWISAEAIMRAGVTRKKVVANISKGTWEWRRDSDGVVEVKLSSLPDLLVAKLRELGLHPKVDAAARAKVAAPKKTFAERIFLEQLPEEMRTGVLEAFSKVIDDRIHILVFWGKLDQADRRRRAVLVARDWERAAKPLAHLYPTLSIYVHPAELDRLAALAEAATEPTALGELVLDLDRIRINTKAVEAARQAQG